MLPGDGELSQGITAFDIQAGVRVRGRLDAGHGCLSGLRVPTVQGANAHSEDEVERFVTYCQYEVFNDHLACFQATGLELLRPETVL